MSDDLPVVEATDDRAAVQEALAAHLGQEIRVRELFAVESQLNTGYLIIVGGRCYFLCARFGGWSVHSEFATADVTGIEVMPSFSTEDLFEVRVQVRGRLHRFSGFDQRGAKALADAIEAAGGEAAKVRPARQASPARKHLSFSDSLSARPAYKVGAPAEIPSLSRGLSSSPPPPSSSPSPSPPPPPRSSPVPQAGAFPMRTVSKSFSEMMAEVDDDDDDDDLSGGGDGVFDSVEDDDDDSEEFEKLLEEMDRRAVASEPKTASVAKPAPKVRPFVRGISAAFLFPVFVSLGREGELTNLAAMPEIAPYVPAVVIWCSVAIPGGLVSLSFDRTLMMLIAGLLAAGAVVTLVPLVGSLGFLVGWFLISSIYILSRGASSAFVKAGLVTFGMAMFAGMGADEGTMMIFVGIFWLAHGYLELAELNTAAKKAA